jgi:hypothetical protein
MRSCSSSAKSHRCRASAGAQGLFRGNGANKPLLIFTLLSRLGDDLRRSSELLLAAGYTGYNVEHGYHIRNAKHAAAAQRTMQANTTAVMWFRTDNPASARVLPRLAAPVCAVPQPGVLEGVFTPVLRPSVRIACSAIPGVNGGQCLPIDDDVTDRVRSVLAETLAVAAGNTGRLSRLAVLHPYDSKLKLPPLGSCAIHPAHGVVRRHTS